MTALTITEKGCLLVSGEPEYYVSDSDFAYLLKSEDLAETIYKNFNRPVCIGRLGRPDDGNVYKETTLKDVDFTISKRVIDFYEKV